MQILSKDPGILGALQSFSTFYRIEPEALQWLIAHSQYKYFEKGERIFEPGQPVEEMELIIKGKCSIQVQQPGGLKEIALWESGAIIGVLPFSRMKEARALGVATEPTHLLSLHKQYFTEMVNRSYELTQALVARMSDRVRSFTQNSVQQEKLAALGKLSAGLAHELNNPASAMVRNAEELYQKIHATPERFKAIMTMGITPAQTDEVNGILFAKIQAAPGLELSLMEREERVDDLLDWLEEQGVEEADDIADTFVDFGLGTNDLDRVANIVGDRALPIVLWWLESTLSLERLVGEIREASGRISHLVTSIKEYSHMDRGTAFEPVDLKKGLNSTLTMLKHLFKNKQVEVVRDWAEGLPNVEGLAGELNQVWTNLIANAVEAMPASGGRLLLRAFPERDFVQVEVEDNGSGIPEDIINRIFEPFFTTKSMGEGTGMGLDIVKKIVEHHRGDIQVDSEPGKTVFRLRFPAIQ